ncbi:hypothetical protein BKA81DRAFT_129922 [Phyllosticta paracitricarpa]
MYKETLWPSTRDDDYLRSIARIGRVQIAVRAPVGSEVAAMPQSTDHRSDLAHSTPWKL